MTKARTQKRRRGPIQPASYWWDYDDINTSGDILIESTRPDLPVIAIFKTRLDKDNSRTLDLIEKVIQLLKEGHG